MDSEMKRYITQLLVHKAAHIEGKLKLASIILYA